MPTLKLEDGATVFIPDESPETIKKYTEAYNKTKQGETGVLGDIGRGLFLTGPQRAVQGLAETGSSLIDFIADTDLTADVKEHFDRVAYEKPKTQAGEIASFFGQFGIPGLGAAGVLTRYGKAKGTFNKAKGALGFGAVDGAVATDDTVTISDLVLDSESDEERLARLDGSEAAAKRLLDKMNVAAEASAFVFGLPLALSGTKAAAKKSIDFVAPAASHIAKIGLSAQGKLTAKGLDESLLNTNKTFYDRLKNNFTFKRDKPTVAVAKAMGAKTATVLAAQEAVNDAFQNIIRTVNQTNKGSSSQTQKMQLARDVEDYMFPRVKVDFEFPNLSQTEARSAAKSLQQQALTRIKNLETDGGLYKGIDLKEGLKISELLESTRGQFNNLSKSVLKAGDSTSDEFTNLFINTELRDAIKENMGLYGTRVYKAFIDGGFKMDPKLKQEAIEQIMRQHGVDEQTARSALNDLVIPRAKNKDAIGVESADAFVDSLRVDKGILKGRNLDSLEKVRKALGEVAGYTQSKPEDALNNTALMASLTASRLATLTAKSKVYDDIFKLDKNAAALGEKKFLRDQSYFDSKRITTSKEGDINVAFDTVGPDDVPIKFKQFNQEHGSLNGKFVRADFFDAITRASSDFQANPLTNLGWYKPVIQIKSGSQYGKTVLSPGAQTRNFTSVPFFALLNGNVGNTGRYMDAVQTTFAGLIDPKTKTLKKEILKELREEGLSQAGGGGRLAEIRDLANLSFEGTRGGTILSRVGNIPGIKQTDKFLQKTYAMTDNTARVFSYMGEKKRFLQAMKNNTDGFVPVQAVKNMTKYADLVELNAFGKPVIRPSSIINKFGDDGLEMFARAEAGDIAQQTVQNYQRTMGFVDQLKLAPVGNFVAFPAEIFRNTGNAVSRAIREVASENPEIQKIGMRRLAGATFTLGGTGYALERIGTTLTGVDQEKVEAYKRSYGMPWDKTATLIPVASDKDGNPTQFFNFSYMNPYDYLNRPVNRVFMEVAEGNRNEESLLKTFNDSALGAVSELSNSFVEPAFSIRAVVDSGYGRTATGRRIWGESDTIGDRLAKSFLYVTEQTLPSITPFTLASDLGTDGGIGVDVRPKNFPKAVFGLTGGKGEDLKTKSGQDLDVADTMVQAFTGFKVVKPQIDRTLLFRGFEASREIRDATNQFNSYLRQFEPKEAEQYLNAYINSNEKRFRTFRDLYTAIDDAKTLGLSEREIETQLKKAKVANYRDVMRNRFRPIELNTDLLRTSPAPQDIKTPINVIERDIRQQNLEGQFRDPRNDQSPGAQILRQQELEKLVGGS
jgi:hypothetical protein